MRTERKEEVMILGRAVMFLPVFMNDEGQREFLLEKRVKGIKGFANTTMIPGGKNEGDEIHDKAVRREVEEELGLKDIDPIPLGTRFGGITNSPHKYDWQGYLVLVKDKGLVENKEPEKGVHVWMSYEQAKEILYWSHNLLVLEWAEQHLRDTKDTV